MAIISFSNFCCFSSCSFYSLTISKSSRETATQPHPCPGWDILVHGHLCSSPTLLLFWPLWDLSTRCFLTQITNQSQLQVSPHSFCRFCSLLVLRNYCRFCRFCLSSETINVLCKFLTKLCLILWLQSIYSIMFLPPSLIEPLSKI